MTIASKVEWTLLYRLSQKERALVLTVYRPRNLSKAKVRVVYADSPVGCGDLSGGGHENWCAIYLGPLTIPTEARMPCNCAPHLQTFTVTREEGKYAPAVTLHRFVPRPLRLRDAIRFGEFGDSPEHGQVLMDHALENGLADEETVKAFYKTV